ncbi:hypothetical protein COCNU_scaffold001144G000020 [Cocos nucifera]|nr:hypothetical protein [Cocos nucifera]
MCRVLGTDPTIEAEEAQRLRKKRKAENLRLIEMEKRQKQRLEEIWESQKKDKETMHLKEQFRAEIKKELDKMEMRYRDMASLLRGLGIRVEGGPFPLSCEVLVMVLIVTFHLAGVFTSGT